MHTIPELDKKGLRDFGLLFAGFVTLLFGLVLPYFGEYAFPLWPWVVSGLTVIWSLALPMSLRPFYRLWMRIGMTIGNIVNKVLLGLMFFLVVSPVALLYRFMGNDPMARTMDKAATSYRIASKPPSRKNMEKPF